MPSETLNIVLHQTAPLLGEVERNLADLRDRANDYADRDLLVFPELSLTGYTLRTRARRLALHLSSGDFPTFQEAGPPMALGFPERGDDELVYNTVAVFHGRRVLAAHRKVYLPTYGPFDEGRFFARGRRPPPVVALPTGWRVGLLVCEDFWHPGLLYLLAVQGVDLVLVLAAAPGRGDPSTGEEGLEPGFDLFSSSGTWTLLARTAAIQYGCFLAIANRAGVEEGVTFAGESVVVAPDGAILGRAPQGEPAVLEAKLSRRLLRRARTPYAHLRDEDPDYLLRALEKLRHAP
jgi:predicted amidohydrolase